MKRLLVSISAFALVLVCFLLLPSKAEATSFGTCGAKVSWGLSDNGTLTISGTGVMQYYSTYNPAPWSSLRSSIKSIIVQEGVTSIGSYAFYYCDNLTSVTLPDSLTNIGSHVFYGCESLAEVTIPDSTTYIGDFAFSYCEKLTGIIIPDNVTNIGENTFLDCKNLKIVTIGNGVTTIENLAFSYCESLTAIKIPDSVTTIGNSVFSSCSSLTTAIIGNSVTTIGSGAFDHCTSLTSITIPDSVVSIDTGFYDCKKLTSLIIAEGSESITDAMVVCKSQLTKVYIPSSVNAIDATAFSDCSSLTGVYITDIAAWCNISFDSYTSNPLHYSRELYVNDEQVIDLVIPDGVVRIGDYAFYDCDSVKTITIPDSVNSVGDYAFAACRSLKYTICDNANYLGNASNPYLYLAGVTFTDISSVMIHADTKIVGSFAFYACTNLTSVTIPDSVTTVSNYAFYNCSRLTSVTIGAGATAIGEGAFFGCASLSSVSLGNNVANIHDYAFYNCDQLASIAIPDSVTVIGKQVFYDCDDLNLVTFGNKVAIIGDYVFSDCDRLTSIVIPDSLKTIGNYAFYNCSNLTSITLGDNVTTIGDYAFYGCSSLNYTTYDNAKYLPSSSNPHFYLAKATSTSITSATIHMNTRFIGESAFEGCYNLNAIIIPDNVTVIGNRAFYCINLDAAIIGDGVTSIGEWAFYGNDITSIAFPISINVIGTGAFFSCNQLTDVYYAGNQSQWDTIRIAQSNDVLNMIDVWFYHSAMHTFTTYTSNDNATCTTDGTETATCNYCNKTDTRTEAGSAKGHSYDSGKVTKAATCKATGVKTYTCKTCKATKTATIAKLTTHTYKTTTTKATLSKNGSIVKKCTVCGKAASTTTISYPKTFKLSATSYAYDGTAKTPTVTVKDAAGKTLKKGTDYTVTYSSGRKIIGTYKVTIKMAGNYSGSKTLTFQIKVASVSTCTFKLAATSYTYNGKAKTPAVTVKNAAGKTLKKGTDYTVTYADGRKNVGTYKVTIKMKGSYSGTKTLTFKIIPRAASINKLTAKSKAIQVKLNRSLQQSTGYEIQYSTAKGFKGAKTTTVKSYKTSFVTLSKLKAKTTYYVRVRTYKTVNGTKIYSNWCTVKHIKTK